MLFFFILVSGKKARIWAKILLKLVENECNNNGRFKQPSRIAIDSQSVKQSSFITKDIGVDGGKKVKGRKRHIAVDSLGLPVGISVTAANVYICKLAFRYYH